MPVLAETPVTQRSPCYSAVSSSLMNPLPDCSIIRHFATPITSCSLSSRINTHYSLRVRPFTKSLRWRIFTLLQRFTAESSRELMSSEEYLSALRKLNNKQRQVMMFILLLFKLSSQFSFVSFSFPSLYLYPLSAPSLSSPFPHLP